MCPESEGATPTLGVDGGVTRAPDDEGCDSGADSAVGVATTPDGMEEESDLSVAGTEMRDEEEAMQGGVAVGGAEEEGSVGVASEVDEAAVLNGEQVLELLTRVSPVGGDSLTTVGMVRRRCFAYYKV